MEIRTPDNWTFVLFWGVYLQLFPEDAFGNTTSNAQPQANRSLDIDLSIAQYGCRATLRGMHPRTAKYLFADCVIESNIFVQRLRPAADPATILIFFVSFSSRCWFPSNPEGCVVVMFFNVAWYRKDSQIWSGARFMSILGCRIHFLL